ALTAEKKREKIQEINAETEQEIAKIIPAKQLEAFKACQAERDQENAKRQGAKGQKELGPCGGVIPPQPGAPAHQNQPGNPPKRARRRIGPRQARFMQTRRRFARM